MNPATNQRSPGARFTASQRGRGRRQGSHAVNAQCMQAALAHLEREAGHCAAYTYSTLPTITEGIDSRSRDGRRYDGPKPKQAPTHKNPESIDHPQPTDASSVALITMSRDWCACHPNCNPRSSVSIAVSSSICNDWFSASCVPSVERRRQTAPRGIRCLRALRMWAGTEKNG